MCKKLLLHIHLTQLLIYRTFNGKETHLKYVIFPESNSMFRIPYLFLTKSNFKITLNFIKVAFEERIRNIVLNNKQKTNIYQAHKVISLDVSVLY